MEPARIGARKAGIDSVGELRLFSRKVAVPPAFGDGLGQVGGVEKHVPGDGQERRADAVLLRLRANLLGLHHEMVDRSHRPGRTEALASGADGDGQGHPAVTVLRRAATTS